MTSGRFALVALSSMLLMSCGGPSTESAAEPTVSTAQPTTLVSTTVALAPQVRDHTAAGSTDQVVTSAESCAFEYSPETLAQRGWAFDGTLSGTGAINDSRLGSVPSATFHINRWYRGGSGNEVTVQYETGVVDEFAPSVAPGTRLLVAGEPRWGGQPLDDAVAWGCGFTQPWTADAATAWATAFGTD